LGSAGQAHSSQNCEVRGFGSAAKKYDLAGVAMQDPGDTAARRFQALARELAVAMDTGGIAIDFNQSWNQVLQNFRRYGRGCVVIKVETRHFNG
jgi:hypothetical protein